MRKLKSRRVALEINHGEDGKFGCFSAIDELDNELRNYSINILAPTNLTMKTGKTHVLFILLVMLF